MPGNRLSDAARPVDLAVEVHNLQIDLPGGGDIVSDVSFSIRSGHVLGLVGESGSGKTTVGMAMLGFARGGARIVKGVVHLAGDRSTNLLSLRSEDLRKLRGRKVAYVPQDPAAALNPSVRIRTQLTESVLAHEPRLAADRLNDRVVAAMADVGLPWDDAFLSRYPHQLSGGQQQRIGIAMAMIVSPRLIVLDEPTTGLDVTTQNKILNIVRRLCRDHGIGALYVTHDLSVMAHIADEVMIMYAGRIAEFGPARAILKRPRHPYTQALLKAVPDLHHRTRLVNIPGCAPRPSTRPEGCLYNPRCPIVVPPCRAGTVPLETTGGSHLVRCLRSAESVAVKREPIEKVGSFSGEAILEVRDLEVAYGKLKVLDRIDLTLRRGECLALVGESGSGKSTLSRAVIGLAPHRVSLMTLYGETLAPGARQRTTAQRRSMQYIFQSPYNSLNPRQTTEQLVGLVYDTFRSGRGPARRKAITGILDQVELSPETLRMFPDQLSGGERQRVAIARALMADPEILICDEITSALDVSVQASIINLLKDLQFKRGLTMLFVTHNLSLVRNLADRVLVLDQGKAVEVGDVAEVIDEPRHSYTRQLIENTLDADVETRCASVGELA